MRNIPSSVSGFWLESDSKQDVIQVPLLAGLFAEICASLIAGVPQRTWRILHPVSVHGITGSHKSNPGGNE